MRLKRCVTLSVYVENITLRNFKSFKQSNITFGKGFNCIVGPNGSGKSNIFDSLLFALGETSLKRMRVGSSQHFINLQAKPNPDTKLKSAYVKVELAGDEKVELERVVRSNGKVGYRLNGKAATRQEVVEVLRAHNCNIDDTNTVTQGEISYIGNLNPKERRELIDIAAGIKEFNDKKASALKELEKVELKLSEANITLKERQGFLSGLEKEKKDAEKYNELNESVRRISYTILKEREAQIDSLYQASSNRYMGKADSIKELEKKAAHLDDSIKAESMGREQVANKLNESSVEANAANKVIDDINKKIAVKNSEIAANEERIKEYTARVEALSAELASIIEKMKSAELSIIKMEEESKEKHEQLGKYDKQDVETDQDTLASEHEQVKKKVGELSTEIEEISRALFEGSTASSDAERRLSETVQALQAAKEEHSSISDSIKRFASSIEKLGGEAKSARAKTKSIEEKAKSAKESLMKIDEDHINLRETLASVGGQDRHSGILSKELGKVFHGKVQELCTYDEKYALAINASAMARLNYFVVDSAEHADKAIRILKTKGLGRASFIPLQDIVVRESQSKSAKSATPLLELVKFDQKYKKAFDFVFGNTFLVEDIAAAKKIGFGGMRFVTLEGDVVEPAGTITGGSMKTFATAAVIQGKIKDLEQRRKQAVSEIAEIESELLAERTSAARFETEAISVESEKRHAETQLSRSAGLTSELEKRKSEIESTLKSRQSLHQKYQSRKEQLSKEFDSLKGQESELYSKITTALHGGKVKALSKAEAERLRSLKEATHQLDMQVAGTRKELEISKERKLEIETNRKKEESELTNLKAKKSPANKEISDLQKSREELENKIKGNDSSTKSLYQKLAKIDAQISAMANEKGKLTAEAERHIREQIALEGERSQLQTRLSDIKAELMGYQETKPLEIKEIKKLDEMLASARAEITAIGAVNLKAPEMFDIKKSEVDTAREKMVMLEGEKGSITSMIDEIDSKKLSVFIQTLEQVNRNFGKLYSSVFDGTAELELSNPKEPFDSGLNIRVKPKTGKTTGIELFSGGQKSIIALVLLFAIQMRNPMSLYIFDEIDAALDKENSKKLSGLIKQMSATSQFIVISHNDEMIVSSDIAIGVISRENISKAFGIRVLEGGKVEGIPSGGA